MMNILPITNVTDYEAALERVQVLMDAERDTPEGAELEILSLVVDAYEEIQHPMHHK